MATRGTGAFQVNSDWSSGNLIFFEKLVGMTTAGNVLLIGTGAVKIGDTANDVDFQFYGTDVSAIIDSFAKTFTLVGITSTTNKPLSVTDATASTSTTTGALKITGGVGVGGAAWIGGGISSSGQTLTPDANRTYIAYQVGSRATPKDITMVAADTQHLEPVQINLGIKGANPSGTSTVNVIYQKLTHETTAMAALRLKQADWYMSIKKNVLDVYNMQLETQFGAASITVGGEACPLGIVLDAGASAVTCSAWRGINITMRGAGTPATAQALFIDGAADITLREAIWICGGGITAAIRLARVDNYANAPTNLLALPPAGYNPVSAAGGTIHSGTVVKVACLVGDTPYYLLASTAIS